MLEEDFVKPLLELAPDKKKAELEGFDNDYYASEIYVEFNLKKKKKLKDPKSLFDEFISNYESQNFRILNIFFIIPNINIISGHIVFSSIEAGYISYETNTGKFYTCYDDETYNTLTILCENEKQFFEILLIVATYSRGTYEGLITDEDEVIRKEYIEKCEDIFMMGTYEMLFE